MSTLADRINAVAQAKTGNVVSLRQWSEAAGGHALLTAFMARVKKAGEAPAPPTKETGKKSKGSGEPTITVASIEALAKFAGVRPAWLAFGDGPMLEGDLRLETDPFLVAASAAMLDHATREDTESARRELQAPFTWQDAHQEILMQKRTRERAAKAVREAASAEKAEALHAASRPSDDSPTPPPKRRKKGRESAAEEPRALDERFSGLTKVGANLKDEDASNATSKRSRK